ncbi:MAG: hypothetical protein FJW40_12045 [Acidobacteria bacterium]|nr:hypothetical protein [Acidobacteriota bacterium]
MTNAERVASAINARKVAWNGGNSMVAAPTVLTGGTPQMNISAPASVAGTYLLGTAAFGASLPTAGIPRDLMPVVDQANGTGLACTALSALNAAAVNGKIALVDRGTCSFSTKAAFVQAAGAVALVIANNVAGSPPPSLGGSDPSITIPVVSITQADGGTLRIALRNRSRTSSGVVTTLIQNLLLKAGADEAGSPLLFTPSPFISGSSVSHWDQSATPNQLMEPSISGNLTHSVDVPADLTKSLLKDLGW